MKIYFFIFNNKMNFPQYNWEHILLDYYGSDVLTNRKLNSENHYCDEKVPTKLVKKTFRNNILNKDYEIDIQKRINIIFDDFSQYMKEKHHWSEKCDLLCERKNNKLIFRKPSSSYPEKLEMEILFSVHEGYFYEYIEIDDGDDCNWLINKYNPHDESEYCIVMVLYAHPGIEAGNFCYYYSHGEFGGLKNKHSIVKNYTKYLTKFANNEC